MAGGNFDSPLHIGAFNHRVEWPVGPLTLDPGETALYVEAWVVQASTGSAQSSSGLPGSFPPNKWLADSPKWRRGNFQPGPAVGIALVWAQIGTVNTYFWWSADPVQLL